MLARLALDGLALCSAVAGRAADPAKYMTAELVAQTAAPKRGSTILVGFKMDPRPGWHGYWSNPGDSGIAPSVEWSAPEGVSFGPLLHPAPSLLTADSISSFVHEGPHVLLSRMSIPRSFAAGTPIPVEARLNWAACTATQCVPLHATLKLSLAVGDGAAGPDSPALLAAARRIPKQAPAGTFVTSGRRVRLFVPATLGLAAASTRFFPDNNDAFNTARASSHEEGGALVISGSAEKTTASISGVVTDGRSAYRIRFDRGTPIQQAATSPPPEKAAAAPQPAIAPVAETRTKPPAPAPAPAAAPQQRTRDWPWIVVAGAALLAVCTWGVSRRRG